MNIFITGACGGLGKVLVQILAKNPENYIIATDIHSQYDFSLKNVQYYQLDVSKFSKWNSLIKRVEKKYPIDVLLNVAGIIEPAYVYQYTQSQIDKQIDINLKGVMYGTTLVAKKMKERGYGHIINIASLAGVAPIPGISLYSTTKFAVRGFSLAIAEELKPYGIHVSVVCPDAIRTPMLDLQKNFPEAALTFSNFRYLTPHEVANVIIKKALMKKSREILVPWYRGWLAKLSNVLPFVIRILFPILVRLGRNHQKRYNSK